MVQDIREVFSQNSKGFCEKYKWPMALMTFALCCDALSTVNFMYESGPEMELHPGVKFFSIAFGIVAGPMLSAVLKAAMAVIVCIYLKKFAAYIIFTGTFVSLWAAWYNVWGCNIYTPLFLKLIVFGF